MLKRIIITSTKEITMLVKTTILKITIKRQIKTITTTETGMQPAHAKSK